MSLEGLSVITYPFDQLDFSVDRGVTRLDPSTGSQFTKPAFYNVRIPTGVAERVFVTGGVTLTIVDPNGEGVCKPRLVAVANFSFKLINSLTAIPGPPFESVVATRGDIADLCYYIGDNISIDDVFLPEAEA